MQVKCITLNLFEGGIFFDEIITFLKKENPDILLLQEVYHNVNNIPDLPNKFSSFTKLQEYFSSYDSFFAREMLYLRPEGDFEVGNAIFSRFPIKERNVVFYDYPFSSFPAPFKYDTTFDFSVQPSNLQYAGVNINDQILHVYNTHGIWGFHGEDTPRRLAMGKIIHQEVQGKKRVILGGDFNLFPTTQTVRLIEQSLKNVFGNSLQTTFNMRKKPHKGNYASSIVDMLFVSNDITVLEKYCPDVDVSDHFPLVCVVDTVEEKL